MSSRGRWNEFASPREVNRASAPSAEWDCLPEQCRMAPNADTLKTNTRDADHTDWTGLSRDEFMNAERILWKNWFDQI